MGLPHLAVKGMTARPETRDGHPRIGGGQRDPRGKRAFPLNFNGRRPPLPFNVLLSCDLQLLEKNGGGCAFGVAAVPLPAPLVVGHDAQLALRRKDALEIARRAVDLPPLLRPQSWPSSPDPAAIAAGASGR